MIFFFFFTVRQKYLPAVNIHLLEMSLPNSGKWIFIFFLTNKRYKMSYEIRLHCSGYKNSHSWRQLFFLPFFLIIVWDSCISFNALHIQDYMATKVIHNNKFRKKKPTRIVFKGKAIAIDSYSLIDFLFTIYSRLGVLPCIILEKFKWPKEKVLLFKEPVWPLKLEVHINLTANNPAWKIHKMHFNRIRGSHFLLWRKGESFTETESRNQSGFKDLG